MVALLRALDPALGADLGAVQTLLRAPHGLLRHLRGAVALAEEPKLKGSVGEGPNQTNYSDRSSVRILAKFRNFR